MFARASSPISALALVFTLALLGPGSVNAQSPASESHKDAARLLIDYLNIEARIRVAVEQLVNLQIQRNPRMGEFKPQLKEFVGKYYAWDTVLPDLVDVRFGQ